MELPDVTLPGSIVLAWLVREAVPFMKKKGSTNGNGHYPKVADMPVSEMELKMSKVIDHHLTSTVVPILQQIKDEMVKHTELQQKQNESLAELVTVSRIGRRL